MKNKPLIYGLIGLLLLLAGLVIGKNIFFQVQKHPKKSSQSSLPASEQCGIEQCHGFEITCGPNVPDACTEIYQAGDNCRQFVSCEIVNNECQLVTTLEFEGCQVCVEQCYADFQDDPIEFFQCENNCAFF